MQEKQNIFLYRYLGNWFPALLHINTHINSVNIGSFRIAGRQVLELITLSQKLRIIKRK